MSFRLVIAAVAVVALPPAISPVLAQKPTADPIFFYSFDNAAATAVLDDAGGGLDAAFVSGAAITGANKKFGAGALDLGGAGNGAFARGAVDDEAFQSIVANDAFTVAFFQYGGEGQPNNNINFRAHNTATTDVREIGTHAPWSNSTIFLDTSGCCGTTQRLNGAWAGPYAGEWTHFAFTKNGESTKVWVNGVELLASPAEEPKEPLDVDNPINQFTIGGGPNGENSVNGFMDEFIVFDSELSSGEISWLSNNQFDKETPIAPADVNKDGVVDLVDYGIIRDNFGDEGAGRTGGDITGDGVVDLYDFGMWKDSPAAVASQAAVPEPTAGALAALGALLVALRSRRRS